MSLLFSRRAEDSELNHLRRNPISIHVIAIVIAIGMVNSRTWAALQGANDTRLYTTHSIHDPPSIEKKVQRTKDS